MAATKAVLRSIKTAIDSKDFAGAAQKAADLVKQDPSNYMAYLFLGFARDKLNEMADAEVAYQKALTIRPGEPQALKGLITLYEKQGGEKLDQYQDVVYNLATHYAGLDDKIQCQSVIDKFELFARKHGSQAQYRHALELLLPSCSLYSFLEGRVPRPSHTYTRILESAEMEEREWINTQIGERRTRLGAKIEQVTQQVKLEAAARFQLEAKYRDVINWIEDDEMRHSYEEKYLQRAYEILSVLPADAKPPRRDEVLNLANGMVIIKHAFQLAWTIALDWVDAETLSDWDANVFRDFIEYFPDDGLNKVLRGYLKIESTSLRRNSETPLDQTPDIEPPDPLSEADRLILLNEGIEYCPSSLLAHRIMAETYLSLGEFKDTVEISRKTQALYLQAIEKYGLDLQNSLDAVNIVLANALIHHQSPRYHPESRRLFENIVKRKPTSTAALLGIGLILEEDEDYAHAVDFLERASRRDPHSLKIHLELAWCIALNGDLTAGLGRLEGVLANIQAEDQVNLEMKSEALFRIGYCKWHLDSSPSARREKAGAYSYFLDSIKANREYAPAYTLLGIYFDDYGKSRKRARVAFQKAFELSPSEVEAAERLANTFADGAEWDLVELVAQRVIDSGKARPAPGSKKKAFSWPYAAVGVVEMNRQQYSKSIVAYQSALRISPEDYHCWVGLGESYHHSGRYVAAAKAFSRAESLDHGLPEDQAWFAKYMLANVQREMGLFDEAIADYQAVLKIKKHEYGLLIALLQTIVESARHKLELGMFGTASKLAQEAIEVAAEIAQSHAHAFNLWKAVGDACLVLASTRAFTANFNPTTVQDLLRTDLSDTELEILAEIDHIRVSDLQIQRNGDEILAENTDYCTIAAILAHKRSVHESAPDSYAQAVSWFNLGFAEYQAYMSNPQSGASMPKSQRFLKAAIRCFKRAIELEAGNSEFWNALGIATLTMNPKVSQHSFVRSLHLNDRSARTWTNLGVLYLANNDNELANEAFTRAQSADPEYAHAWLGQGLLATLFGNKREARGLFAHAFDIADSSNLPAQRLYSTSAFDQLVHDATISNDRTYLTGPLFALLQLHSQIPKALPFNHLRALLSERLSDHSEAAKSLSDLCTTLESDYESTESPDTLVQFASAKSDLARANLALHDFPAALENAQTALDLSAEDFPPSHTDLGRSLRLSAHLTAGIASHHLADHDTAIALFDTALAESNRDPDVICMLAQLLRARGTAVDRALARDQLTACIAAAPPPQHVRAVTLLGVIALLDDDTAAIHAVTADLAALRTQPALAPHDQASPAQVLAAIAACTGPPGASAAEATTAIMLAPAAPQGWAALAAAVADPPRFPTDMALTCARRLVPPRGELRAHELAARYAATGSRIDALTAVVVAPWVQEGWESLAESV